MRSKIKISFLVLCLSLSLFVQPLVQQVSAATQYQNRPDITIAVNGKLVSMPDQPPVLDTINNRTLVPVRFPAETLGSTVGWKEATQEVTIDQPLKDKLPETHLVLQIGNRTIKVNGQNKQMDTSPIIMNNRTLVPIRFVGEYLKAEVVWWDATNTVHMFTQGQSKEEQQQIIDKVAEEIKPEVKPGQKVIRSEQLRKIADIFRNKGYKVELPTYSDVINDYGTIVVISNKSAANKDQYDKDVYDQVKAFIGTDAAEWVKKMLNACEHPDVTVVNQTKVFGDKSIGIYMYDMMYDPSTNNMKDSDEIHVEFDER